jgi:NADH-quinone oxidoreductase subunit A
MGSSPIFVITIFIMYSNIFYYEVFNIVILIVVSLGLTTVLLFASYLLSSKKPSTEKLSAYECGFDPYEDARNMFDVRFYLVSLLFLIFDLETLYFFPWCVSASKITLDGGLGSFLDFAIELLIGYVYIWKVGVLNWE